MWIHIPNLELLVKDMKLNCEMNYIYPFTFNGKTLQCLIMAEKFPYDLYLASLGSNPFYNHYSISQTFKINTFIEDKNLWRKFCIYLFNKQIAGNTEFAVFYNSLIAATPKKIKTKTDYKDKLLFITKHHIVDGIEEPNKLHFIGWRRNPENTFVSDHNYNKTKYAFDKQFADKSREKRISSRWSDNKEEENIKDINKLFLM